MDMNISKRDLGLLLGLAGLIITAGTYKFVFDNFNNKTADLEAQITTQSSVQAEMLSLEQNMPFYQSEIERMNAENATLEAQFPADILPEDQIMYAASLENNDDIFFTDLSYGTAEEIFGADMEAAAAAADTSTDESTDTTETEAATETAAADTTADGSAAAEPEGISAYRITMSMNYEASYKGLKQTIRDNYSQSERMVFDGLTAAYDATTGQLTGVLTLNQYYLKGTDVEYESPYVPNMKMGVKNIFGTNDGAAN